MKVRNYSRKREAILSKIRSVTCHPTADWVFQELREEYPDLSLATVYRNLVLFKEDGSIASVCGLNGQERFDGNIHPHGHFICRRCRAVIDVNLPLDKTQTITYLENIPQYRVDRVDFTAYGLCDRCSEAV